MARTKGSGWGGGVIHYQICPFCKKKKAYYDQMIENKPFKCTSCKGRFNDTKLNRLTYISQLNK